MYISMQSCSSKLYASGAGCYMLMMEEKYVPLPGHAGQAPGNYCRNLRWAELFIWERAKTVR